MARTALTVQKVTRNGVDPSYGAANADGHSFANTGREFLHVKNGTTAVVVTLKIPRTLDGQAVTDRTVTVPDGGERMIGPFPPRQYNQRGGTGDVVHVDFDDVSNVTLGVFRI